MKTTGWNKILVGIGAILVLALVGMPIQNADALDSTVLYKLQSIQNDIDSLKENTQNFDINKIGSQTFYFRAVGENLLEVQKTSHDTNDREIISKVLDFLIIDYKETYNEYLTQVEEYERSNSVDMKQTQIVNEMIQSFIDFKTADESNNKKVNHNKFVQSEIKRSQNEEKFQAYINKVAIKMVDANNGNKVQKIYHEVALEKIAEEKNWDIVAPAMDRIINQFSNPEIKHHLEMYKEKVLYSIENLKKSQQKQPEILTLTSDVNIKDTIFDVIFNTDNEIQTSSIVLAQLEDEIKSIIGDYQKIVEDENTRIETQFELQRIDSQEEDEQDSIRKKILASQSEPKPGNNGNGDGNSNSNGNGNSNSNGNGNSNGNDGGNDSEDDNDNSNGNSNGNGNGKGKGKKA